MQYLPGKRVLALVAGLAIAAAGSAYAQDTTETGAAAIDTTAPTGAIDTSSLDTAATDTTDTTGVTDTSGVQNPPGYQGMERDTTAVPDTESLPSDTGAVQDQATGAYDSLSKDTSGIESSAGGDTTAVGETEPMEADTATSRIEPGEQPAAGDTAVPTPDSTQ
jgi:hypothetical protein